MVNVHFRYENYLRGSRWSYSEATYCTNPTTNPIPNLQLYRPISHCYEQPAMTDW